MNWTAQVFGYCERGADPSFWAEPLNAVSNAAFIVAAVLASMRRRAMPAAWRSAAAAWLIGLVFVIGVGSFLFHTTATRWARLADVVPIGAFMMVYLAFALHRFLAVRAAGIAAATVGFLLVAALVGSVNCGGRPCFNGSLGYLPALMALGLVGLLASADDRAVGRALLLAAALLAVSLVLRGVDLRVCARTLVLPGWRTGTHALWHLVNAVVLYILLRLAVNSDGKRKT